MMLSRRGKRWLFSAFASAAILIVLGCAIHISDAFAQQRAAVAAIWLIPRQR